MNKVQDIEEQEKLKSLVPELNKKFSDAPAEDIVGYFLQAFKGRIAHRKPTPLLPGKKAGTAEAGDAGTRRMDLRIEKAAERNPQGYAGSGMGRHS